MNILGIRIGHDAAACLVINGKVVADVEEERFSRIKKDASFPLRAIEYSLKAGNIKSDELDVIAIPAEPFQDALHTFFEFPSQFELIRYRLTNNHQIKNRLFSHSKSTTPAITTNKEIRTPRKRSRLNSILPLYQAPFRLSRNCKLCFVNHHLAHAASAYYTAPFSAENALGIVMDGCGDNISNSVWEFSGSKLNCLAAYGGQTSLGWFYACATEAIGWRQSMDEWKLMGLAPFGKPSPGKLDDFHPAFANGRPCRCIDYGSFSRWNDHGANHYHNEMAAKLAEIAQQMGQKNFAAEVQRISEEVAMNFIMPWLQEKHCSKLICAGGCFLNVKLNQKLWTTGLLEKHWVYPNAGDSGLPLGAALFIHHTMDPDTKIHILPHLYHGPEFSNEEIKDILDARQLSYEHYNDIIPVTVDMLCANKVVGWFQGRMEAGPRALGNRSILMSPLREDNRDIINRKIKYRETFRPFCPSLLYEKAGEYFTNWRDAGYMTISFPTKPEARHRIPAVVHIDHTARPQFVQERVNPRYYRLIKLFGERTGESVLLNTSFNIKGEPIVCTPREALKCFFDTGMDALILGDFLVRKN